MIIIRCSGMFRDVPECSMFLVLSTALNVGIRIVPERIQIFPIFSEEIYWQKFRKFQILAVVALDQHVGTKTLLIEIHVTRSKFLN